MHNGRIASLNPLYCISHALFASAVVRRLAVVVDKDARRILVGEGGSLLDADDYLLQGPISVRFENLAKQLMKVRNYHKSSRTDLRRDKRMTACIFCPRMPRT